MELRRAATVIRRSILLIVVGTVLAGVTAFLVSSSMPKTYSADATVIVGQFLNAVNPDSNQLLVSQRLSETYAELAVTPPLLDRVNAKLNLNTSSTDLAKRVSAEAHQNTTLLTITARDGAPDRAAAIANEVAQQLIAMSPTVAARQELDDTVIERNLKATQEQIDQAQAQLDALIANPRRTPEQDASVQSLENRLASLRSTYASLLAYTSTSGSNLLSVVSPATTPAGAAAPQILLNTALGALAGLVAMLALAFTRDYLDDTLKVPDDVEAETSLPTLGLISSIPSGRHTDPMYRLVTLLYPRSRASEAFRTLRTNVEFAGVDAPIASLLVTSSAPGEGKTTVASNLAVAFAQAGRRTVLVDADLRHPEVHRLFKCDNTSGLTTLLRSDGNSVSEALQPTDESALRVLPAGPIPPNPAELLGSQKMRAIIESLKRDADIVVFDSPPVRAVTDAAVLAPIVDATLLVIDSGHTRRAAVRQGRAALVRVGARMIGATLNRVRSGETEAYYGHVPPAPAPDADPVAIATARGHTEPQGRHA
jgi:capsular exopolysaccharide synthesis family protein